MNIDAVVFDCDGLLAETESAWTRAEAALFREHGHDFGPAQKKVLIGQTLASGGEAMAEYFGLPGAGPALAERLAGLVGQELAAGTPALPGARAITETLRRRGIPVAVSSNSPRRFVDTALRSAGLHDLFEVLVSAEDAEHGKPAPDLYLAASGWRPPPGAAWLSRTPPPASPQPAQPGCSLSPSRRSPAPCWTHI